MNGQNALSKINDNPQLVPATVITTNTPVIGLSHDLSNCADAVVAAVLTVSAYSGAGSVKLSLSGSEDNSTFAVIPNDDLVIKDLTTGLEIESLDKAGAVALSGVGSTKLGFIFKYNTKFVKASIVPTGITGSVTASAIIQYEKAFQK